MSMQRDWHLQRNCSLSPRQSGWAYGLLCLGVAAVSIGFATVFAAVGLSIVLAFALLEIGGIVLALLHYARHALDREHIALRDDCLLVERVRAGRAERIRLDPCWTRIALPDHRRSLIGLESRGVRVEVGRFVSEETRRLVGEELRRALRARSFLR